MNIVLYILEYRSLNRSYSRSSVLSDSIMAKQSCVPRARIWLIYISVPMQSLAESVFGQELRTGRIIL